MKKIVFFGVGVIGKRICDGCKVFGYRPDFFSDNDEQLWNTMYDGIEIIAPKKILALEECQIFITCKKSDEIVKQLIALGVSQDNISVTPSFFDVCQRIPEYIKVKGKNIYEKKPSASKILFDAEMGIVLGGVEAWTIQNMSVLNQNGFSTKCFMDAIRPIAIDIGIIDIIRLSLDSDNDKADMSAKCAKMLLEESPDVIVCNFPFANFWGACIVKAALRERVKLIAVIHSDDTIYYDTYTEMKDYIDYCVITCDEMEKLLISRGWLKEKLVRMVWQIPCFERFERVYSEEEQPLRIGYAGRITTIAKRLDLLIELLKILLEKKINFKFEIAGCGDYQSQMEQEIEALGLESRVNFLGFLDRSQINDFWSRQDICINCSDLEGRCISRAEGMAAGAIPIVTDTSSARDDVKNGYNGYVVSVGDMDEMAERICYLYYHRDEMARMGQNARETIRQQNENSDLMKMWNTLLEDKDNTFS